MRASGQPFALIGQVHGELPFMYGDALVAADTFDFLLEDPGTRLFCPPNAPIPRAEYAIALNVSTLVRDGGTLQLGIGELGDAHRATPCSCGISSRRSIATCVESFGLLARHRRLIETEGGTAPFERGLYGCSEMLADGFLDLYRSGMLKRCVYASAKLQRLLDEGHIDEQVSERTLAALHEGGMRRMSFVDFHEFRDVGLFRDDVEYDRGMLVAPDGTQLRANFDDPEQRRQIARDLPRRAPAQRRLADAGFFFGPKEFYEELRNMPVAQRRLFAMRAHQLRQRAVRPRVGTEGRAAPSRALHQHDDDGHRTRRRGLRRARRTAAS